MHIACYKVAKLTKTRRIEYYAAHFNSHKCFFVSFEGNILPRSDITRTMAIAPARQASDIHIFEIFDIRERAPN
jgi:hypothetical protein